jgi:hypothetical protein
LTRAAFALLGVVILGIAAGAVYRELTSPDKRADGASIPDIAATGGTLEAALTGTARKLPDLRFVDRDRRELWRVVGPREWDQAVDVNRIRSRLAQPATH